MVSEFRVLSRFKGGESWRGWCLMEELRFGGCVWANAGLVVQLSYIQD